MLVGGAEGLLSSLDELFCHVIMNLLTNNTALIRVKRENLQSDLVTNVNIGFDLGLNLTHQVIFCFTRVQQGELATFELD